MRRIQHFDRYTCGMVCDDIEQALEEYAKDRGLSIKRGPARFGATNLTLKLEISTISDSGTVLTRESQDWNRYCHRYKLEPDRVGWMFEYHGQTFQITGLNRKASRYPICAERVSDGKPYRFGCGVVSKAYKLEGAS